MSREDALEYCAGLTATHYENFSVVTWLTPRPTGRRSRASTRFAAGRTTWETRSAIPARRSSFSSWWRGELEAMYQGEARHPVMIALAETVERYGIPDRAVRGPDLGLRARPDGHRISDVSTIARLLHAVGQPGRASGPVRCRRVSRRKTPGWPTRPARPFNWPISGKTSPATWPSAGSTCRARIGDRFGYPESDLRALRFTPAFAELLRFEVERARGFLAEGRQLVPRIPGALAVDVDLFSRGGSAILDRDRGTRV